VAISLFLIATIRGKVR